MLNKIEHVAIIMDGNGRWAGLRNKPRTFGHIKGARVAKKIITHASDVGFKYLTLYAFSSENWFRPQTEVSFLMHLLNRYLRKESENLHKKNIRFKVIGEISRLPEEIQKAITNTQKLTAHNTGLTLSFAISYGSRQEIVLAAQKLASKALAGELDPSTISDSDLSSCLMTNGTPDPDLIIRTSGEYRLSNFLMWQAAYSELIFSPVLWPDYSLKNFNDDCSLFENRDRRFGKVPNNNEEEYFA